MNVNPTDAVSHIVNSLENNGGDYWEDEKGVTWVVSQREDSLVFRFEVDDEIIDIKTFRLIEV